MWKSNPAVLQDRNGGRKQDCDHTQYDRIECTLQHGLTDGSISWTTSKFHYLLGLPYLGSRIPDQNPENWHWASPIGWSPARLQAAANGHSVLTIFLRKDPILAARDESDPSPQPVQGQTDCFMEGLLVTADRPPARQ